MCAVHNPKFFCVHRLSRANSETSSVLSSASKRPISGSPFLLASQRAGTQSEAESLQLDKTTLASRLSSLSLRTPKEAGVTFDTKSLKGQKEDSPFGTPRSYQTSTLFGGRPAPWERPSSSPGLLARPRTSDLPGTSRPSFVRQASPPQLAARPSTTGSIAACQDTEARSALPARASPPGQGRKISFSPPAPPATQVLSRGRTLSTQPSSRPLSPLGLDVKRQASTSPLPSAGPARPASSGQRSIRPSPSIASVTSRLGPSTSPPPKLQSGPPRGAGTLSVRTRAQDEELIPPELHEWQAIAKEAKSMLDHGQEERLDVEQRIASLRSKVQGWEGLLDDAVQKFDKSMEEAFQQIFSRARTRVKVHEAHSSSSGTNDAASQHRTAMPTPQPHHRSASAFNPFEAAAAASAFAGQPNPMPAARSAAPHLQAPSQHMPFGEQPPSQHIAYQAMRQQQQLSSESGGDRDHRTSAHAMGPQSFPSYAHAMPGPSTGVQRFYAQPTPGPALGRKSSPSYAQPAPEGPSPPPTHPSMDEAQGLQGAHGYHPSRHHHSSQKRDRPQSHPPHPQLSAPKGPAPQSYVAPVPPQLASAAAACLWQEYANSRAYCPYRNPGEWVALRL
ncbi:hypothetical protein DUNSADRAFT_11874 [Dunaliella salina]|uniref:Uncharacterized protein n=1 Tax=Dunaliella salina TaxID=3046 RepID=A0ABQ7H494_DUNSA|nr:hypothetical protein DUNSADRAFT_11874 [Dunaliella salina]|eukprot:KAF5841668.1 hypothetical protein DUNSADRAFT_11874 [Dunaliella salina]